MRILVLLILTLTLSYRAYSADSITAVNDFVETVQETPILINPGANDLIQTDSLDFEIELIPGSAFGNAVVQGNKKSILYTPLTDFIGRDTLKYRICFVDTALCDSALIIITVLPNPPIANNDVATTNQGSVVNVNVLQNDFFLLGLGLNLTISTSPLNGTATKNPNNTINYNPGANFVGKDSLVYKICYVDYPTICDVAKVVLNVLPTPPTAVKDAATTGQSSAINISVLQNDIFNAGLALNLTIESNPLNGVATKNPNNTINYNPNTSFIGKDSLVYKICYVNFPSICSQTKAVITVTPTPPTAINDAASTTQNNPINVNVLQNDVFNAGLGLTLTIITNPLNGIATRNPNNTINYNPNTNFVGKDSLNYRICYTSYPAICSQTKIVISVAPDALFASNDVATTNQGSLVIVNVLQNDVFNAGLGINLTIVTNPINGSATKNPNNTINYNPNVNFFGKDSLVYRICYADYPGVCSQAKVVFTITPNPPVANNDVASTNEDNAVNINVLQNDLFPFGFNLTLTITTNPKKGTATVNPNNTINYNPNLNFNGFDTLKYRICFTNFPALCDDAEVVIQVIPQNDNPIANDDMDTIPKNEAAILEVLKNDIDVDGNGLTVSIISQPTNGIAAIIGNAVQYVPDIDFVGIDTIIYRICNTLAPAFCDNALIILFVGTENTPPVAVNDTIIDGENENTVNILANDFDEDGDSLLYKIIQNPKHGTLEDDGQGNITYLPGSTFEVIDSFQYQLCDNAFFPACNVAWVYVIGQETDISIPNSFSPNGDGINDIFYIKGLQLFPDNELTVFNRWGEVVLKQKGYDNTWQGELRGAKRATWGNDQIPEGSYFYILTLNGKETYKGYIVIKR